MMFDDFDFRSKHNYKFWERLEESYNQTSQTETAQTTIVSVDSIYCCIVIKSLFILWNNVPSAYVLNPINWICKHNYNLNWSLSVFQALFLNYPLSLAPT